MTVVCTSDCKYLVYLNALLSSININSPDTHVYVRLVNISNNDIEQRYKNVKVVNDSITIDSRPNNVKYITKLNDNGINIYGVKDIKDAYSNLTAYCTNIKYNTLSNLLYEDYDDVLVYLDVDTIVRKDLSDLEDLIKCGDIGIILDNEIDTVFCEGGLIGINNTPLSKQFIQHINDHINLYDITADEVYFDHAVNIYNPTIIDIPRTFKEEGNNNRHFNTEAYMWSGHGDNKILASDYVNEFNMYKQ